MKEEYNNKAAYKEIQSNLQDNPKHRQEAASPYNKASQS